MQEVSGRDGRTVLFVSHNMAAVTKLCKRSILMSKGHIQMFDSTEKVLPLYLNIGTEASGYKSWTKEPLAPFFMQEVSVVDSEGKISGHLDIRKQFTIECQYQILKEVPRFRIALRVITSDGTVAFTASDSADENYDKKPITIGNYITRCHIPGNLLNEGYYSLTLCADVPHATPLFYEESALTFQIEQTGGVSSRFGEKWPGVVCPHLEWTTTPTQ
jgi:lipopolysaccharide transport system ATP-binding protein